MIFKVLGILNMMFLNNLQVFFEYLEGFQEEFVSISQRFVLIDESIGFVLVGFKGGRLSIMDRGRGVGGNSWTGEGESSSILVLSGEVGGSERQGLNGVARGFPPPLPLPLHPEDIRGDLDRTQLIEVIE